MGEEFDTLYLYQQRDYLSKHHDIRVYKALLYYAANIMRVVIDGVYHGVFLFAG